MKTILESYSIKELRAFVNEHNKKARKETTEKLKQIRKNINKKAVIDIRGLTKKTDYGFTSVFIKKEIISRMLKQKQHFKNIKMKKQISQEEKEKFMDDVLNPLLKKAYLTYARTGDADDVEVEVEEIFKKAKEMDIPSNYGITKKKMVKVIVEEGKKDKKIRDEILSKRKTNKDIPPPKPPIPPNMFYSTQAKKFIIKKPTRPAPKLPPKPTKPVPALPTKAKGKEKVKNQEPAPATLQEAVGDRPKKKEKAKPASASPTEAKGKTIIKKIGMGITEQEKKKGVQITKEEEKNKSKSRLVYERKRDKLLIAIRVLSRPFSSVEMLDKREKQLEELNKKEEARLLKQRQKKAKPKKTEESEIVKKYRKEIKNITKTSSVKELLKETGDLSRKIKSERKEKLMTADEFRLLNQLLATARK